MPDAGPRAAPRIRRCAASVVARRNIDAHSPVRRRPGRDPGRRRRAGRHLGQDQGHRRRHDGRARGLGCAVVQGDRGRVRGFSRRDLPARAGRCAAAAGPAPSRCRLPRRQLAEPHPAAAQRQHRHRVRLHHQQRPAAEGRGLRRHDLRRADALCGQGQFGHRFAGAAQGQARVHHHRHHRGAGDAPARPAPPASSSSPSTARTMATASCCCRPVVPTPS